MSRITVLLAIGAIVSLVPGCAQEQEGAGSWIEGNLPQEEYQVAERAEPTGTDFNRYLYEGYMELAARERAEYDWRDSELFSKKALAAAEDDWVAPETLFDRSLPEDSVAELRAAHGDLVSMLGHGARAEVPADAARAQVNFDCWVQEQEENHQPDDIAACRAEFYDALGRVQTAMASGALDYVVYFGTDSAKLAPEQVEAVMSTAAFAKDRPYKILVSGYTDNTGSEARNMTLSKERAEAVEQLLLSAGVKGEQIESAYYGSAQPAVKTEPNTSESMNRRVEIKLSTE